MLMNYHIGRLVLSSLCVGDFAAADIWWCSFCRLKHHCSVRVECGGWDPEDGYINVRNMFCA